MRHSNEEYVKEALALVESEEKGKQQIELHKREARDEALVKQERENVKSTLFTTAMFINGGCLCQNSNCWLLLMEELRKSPWIWRWWRNHRIRNRTKIPNGERIESTPVPDTFHGKRKRQYRVKEPYGSMREQHQNESFSCGRCDDDDNRHDGKWRWISIETLKRRRRVDKLKIRQFLPSTMSKHRV